MEGELEQRLAGGDLRDGGGGGGAGRGEVEGPGPLGTLGCRGILRRRGTGEQNAGIKRVCLNGCVGVGVCACVCVLVCGSVGVKEMFPELNHEERCVLGGHNWKRMKPLKR